MQNTRKKLKNETKIKQNKIEVKFIQLNNIRQLEIIKL